MRCTGTVWEGDSFALEFSDQALLEDQLLVTPNDETICLSKISRDLVNAPMSPEETYIGW